MDVSDETLRALNPELDERNFEILRTRAGEFAALTGPQVGDFATFPNGATVRLTHDWDTSIQTTCVRDDGTAGESGSFYLYGTSVSFSGSLDPPILKSRMTMIGDRPGRFWFFRNNHATAHNGIEVMAPCRLFKIEDFTLDEKRAMYRRRDYSNKTPLREADTSQWTEDDWIRAIDACNGWYPNLRR